jgi:hypothetical protein
MMNKAFSAVPNSKGALTMLTPEDSARDVIKVIDEAARGEEPVFMNHDGNVLPW